MKKLCKRKKTIANNTSPIKVGIKNFGFYQINTVDYLKSLRLSNPLHKSILKKKNIKINAGIIIKKNLEKYNSTQTYFYKKLINQILFNLPYKLVSVFKDYLIWNEIYDYIPYFYALNKSNELLPRLGIYYETYTLFIPIYFPLMDERDILKKYIKNKLKLLEMTKCEDDLRDEFKDVERNIIDCDTNNAIINNKKSSIEDNKELISNKINKGNNEQKLINSSEIKTENSNSVSNYFGIESIIKSKETSINSIYPESEKFENLSSILEQMKNKNKKDNNKMDLDLELASIIQLFEENKKKSKIANNNKTININNIKNSKDLKKNRKLLKIGNQNMTYRNISKIQSKENIQKNKNTNNSIKSKRRINYPKYKNISDKTNHSSKNILISNTCRNLNKRKLFPISNKSVANSERKDYHKNTNRVKDNSKIIKTDIYKSVLSAKNIKKNNIYNLIWNKKSSASKKPNKIKIMIKLQKNYEDLKFPKSNRTINYKSKSKSKKKEKDDLSINKISEYNLIYTSPSNILKNSLKNGKIIKKIRNDNKSFSEGKNFYLNKKYSNIDIRKCIFVNKKESNNYILGNKTNKKLINTIDLSFNTLNSSNKIFVNKMDYLRKNIKIEIFKTPKDKKIVKFITSNSIEPKHSLNHNDILEKEFSTFIPKTVMKKMFTNKIYKRKLLNKPINNSSMKKHEFFSKYYMTYSSNNGNKSKVNINLKKNNKNKFESKINIKNKKNTRIMTKFNKFMTIAPKSIISSYKKDNQSDLRSSSKFSVFSLNESNPCYKNRNTFFKDSIRKMKKIVPYTDRTLESKYKNNLLINSNISNGTKFNSQTEDDKISIKSTRIKYLNNNLKLPNNNYLFDKISSKKEFKNANNNRTIYLTKNITSDNKFLSKNNKKISKQKIFIKNNQFHTIDSYNRITKNKNQNILK